MIVSTLVLLHCVQYRLTVLATPEYDLTEGCRASASPNTASESVFNLEMWVDHMVGLVENLSSKPGMGRLYHSN